MTSSPRDTGLTHAASRSHALVASRVNCFLTADCRNHVTTLPHYHAAFSRLTQTMELNMDWWHSSQLSVQCLMDKLHQYRTWYQYWIQSNSSLSLWLFLTNILPVLIFCTNDSNNQLRNRNTSKEICVCGINSTFIPQSSKIHKTVLTPRLHIDQRHKPV